MLFIRKKHSYHLLIILFFFTFYNSFSQENINSNRDFTPLQIWESGLPYIENFTSDDYKSNPQNWDILEGNDGLMYFGNTDGIVQFDGSSWSTIKFENKNLIRSLTKINDTIYFGGTNELGYLKPDELGQMRLHSLMEQLELTNRKFGNIWTTIALNNEVFFMSQKYLFRWNGEHLKTWGFESKFGGIFRIKDTLFAEIKGIGIHKIVGDSLVLIPGGDVLKNNISKVNVILPHQDNQVVIVTANQGLLLFNGKTTTPFNKSSNEIFLKHPIYKGILLSNGDFAMATTSFGLYIVDGKTGKIKQRIGKKHGLISDVLFCVYEDSNGSIWVGSDNGISKIDWASPFRSFNELNGLTERVRSVSYHNNTFLVDSKGLYQLEKQGLTASNKEPYFNKIDGIDNSIKFIISLEKGLLAFHSEYIYKINENSKAQFIKKESWALTSLLKTKSPNSKVYAGTIEGKLFDVNFVNNKWFKKLLLQIDGGIEGIVEEPNKNIWLQTYHKGLYHINKINSGFNIKHYDTLSGLPSMSYNFPYEFNNKIYVTTQNGMYHYNRKEDTFEKDTILTSQYDKSVDAYGFMGMDSNGTIWQTVRAGFKNKIYKFSENEFSELYEYNLFNDFSTYSMEFLEDIVLFTGPKGILLYNQNKTRLSKKNLTAKLRKVWVNNDSLIYTGSNIHRTKEIVFKIPFKNNALKFEYSLPYYTKSENNTYQYILEGFDKDWSSWTKETKKDYTNIPEGDYSFKVRSKNVFNDISKEDSYSFTILPPLHRTWWAYLLYSILAFTIVAVYSKWRSNELKKKNETLENTINKRTLEIRQKNVLLNHQTEQLELLNDSKTKLYSNITHEFRTPLTVILGMTEILKANVLTKSIEGTDTSLEMIRRNGKNLLQLVNEMLDLAKVESGSMELNLVQTDAIPFVKYLSESFHSLAEAKKINLTVYSEIDKLVMDIDVNKMASIMSNLLSNAIKFTEVNGKVIVHLNKIKTNDISFFSIKVKDNGLGLAEDDIVNLFDRFFQVDNESFNGRKGTGIGLSLAKEFVELMTGTIEVKSVLGKGSTFIVQIPITNNAVKTVEGKITIEQPIKKSLNITKTELSYFDDSSLLPLVLIIEDNEDVAHYLMTCLKGKYQTMHAINGNIGIEMAYEKVPDIIISDVMMPEKDGFEVCDTLKRDVRTDHIPIILLTAKVTTKDRLTGLSYGADAYLAKPFNEKELFIRLDQLVLVRKKLISKLEKNGFSIVLNEKSENPQTKFLQQILNNIHKNLDNANFGPTQLAKEMCLSESQIYRKLKAITDKSTAVFIRSVRLQKAKELIESSHKTVSEIAYEVGFKDPSWFSRAFKEEFGCSPIGIRK
ncbi:hybrid sensor histidine kinase/response regulator transcription factor [Aureibaculum luteum]|uniref:hybrid sensor histidine kinase/response regulator transcription factor n=1 Tax=Aureibaculum luteum TaxID=1548456 RepID=UPI000E4E7838|nr:hybrid sensor histidine kinase/response regulator transcription factor [Aureibaculum luteum]